jgi:glycosyltransferase involved in cell wall biosynthesis
MQIALLTDGIYPYVIGGMQKHSFYLAKYFAKRKINVRLFHQYSKNGFDPEKLDYFTSEERQFIKPTVVRFPSSGKYPGHYIREFYKYSERIFQELKPELKDIDFIYSQGFCGWKLIKEKEKGLKCPPIGINFHGLEMYQKPANLRLKLVYILFRNAISKLLKKSDIAFSLGNRLTDIMLSIGVEKGKIIQIPIGIDESWLKDESFSLAKERTFVFLGRYERRKGIEELTTVLKKLNSKQKFYFHFIGDIPENKRLNVPHIKYWGSLTNSDEIIKILRNSDVLVCPSYSEGMPNVILEGMSNHMAIIASDVGAVNELVSSRNGWLIEPGSTASLSNAITSAINVDTNSLMEKKSISQKIVKENFLFDKIIDLTVSEIKSRI